MLVEMTLEQVLAFKLFDQLRLRHPEKQLSELLGYHDALFAIETLFRHSISLHRGDLS